MAPQDQQSAAHSSDLDDSCDILKEILARKKNQGAKKAQPWKETHHPQATDIPKTISPHDKPWVNGQKPWNWDDSEYDTNGSKT
jgi:hypothetical protein